MKEELQPLQGHLPYNPPRASFGYQFVRWLFSCVIGIFFSTVEVTGIHNIPENGPVIFVGNHSNQFVDAMILMSTCYRDVSFLIAAKSMKRLVVGFFAGLMRSISVARAQDNQRKGIGKVTCSGKEVKGTGTMFTKEFHVDDSITILGNTCKVSQIVSDTVLLVEPSFDITVTGEGEPFLVVPKLDQSKVYDDVWNTLRDGGAIAIFPEGGSHDRTELLPLKAGVTMMALGAMNKYKGLNVKIIPCGLNYLHAHKFRSTAFVEYGKPIEISAETLEQYKTDKRAACGKLLTDIQDALLSVTVSAPDYETLQLIRTVRRLYIPDGVRLNAAQYLHITRRFTTAYRMFADEPDLKALRNKVALYYETLKTFGIKDRQVATMNVEWYNAMELFFARSIYLLILVAFALPGVILHLPIGTITRYLATKKMIQAKKESSVKIAGRDVMASWKILIAFVVMPLVYCFYVMLLFALFRWHHGTLSWKVMIFFPVSLSIVLPILGFCSVLLMEQGYRLYASLRPLFFAMLPIGIDSRRECQNMREQLRKEIKKVVEEYGPKVYPNFDKDNFYKNQNSDTKQFLKEELQAIKAMVDETKRKQSVGGHSATELNKQLETLTSNRESLQNLRSLLESAEKEQIDFIKQQDYIKEQKEEIVKLKAQLKEKDKVIEEKEKEQKLLTEELNRARSRS